MISSRTACASRIGAVVVLLMVMGAFFPSLWAASTVSEELPRPADWAVPLLGTGVINLHRLTPELYRSAQPTTEGMRYLSTELKIRTIINLRSLHHDSKLVSGTGILDQELSVKAWHAEDEDVVRVLTILSDPSQGPFLIHCQFGSDRTGLMCAMYRIIVQGWTKEKAIKEMVEGGYGFHPQWGNLLDYVRHADIAALTAAIHPKH